MLRDFLIEYKNGLWYSIQGFVVLHRLDRTPPTARRNSQPRASSVDRAAAPTVLERRRMEKRPNRKEAEAPTTIRKKVPAFKRVAQCVGINLLVIAVLQVLVWITEWLFPDQQSLLYGFCNLFRNTLILPIFIVIRLLSTLWFADIASAAYKYRGASNSNTNIDISRAASDFLHAVVVELVFLLQTLVLSSVPMPVIPAVYRWMSSGVEMNRRLDAVERHWAYHFGFGTLLTTCTSLSGSFVVNSCVFGALFPFFIVSSFLAEIQEFPQSEVPPINFFFISQIITTKISTAISHKIVDSSAAAPFAPPPLLRRS
ncbi:Etoposide-induced protein 2.4-like protein [Aphelenchoides fujianensis]|nr:Etoposide-induced protein 2.4-like protein [Aphelenchoides fujianensis]